MLKTKVRVVDVTPRATDSLTEPSSYNIQVKLWWLPFVWLTHATDITQLRRALIDAHALLYALDPKQVNVVIPVVA